MSAAPTEAIAAKLREMGMEPAEAARVAQGQFGRDRVFRPSLSTEHREALSRGRQAGIARRREVLVAGVDGAGRAAG